jgi:hypothetical protein
MLWTTRLGPVDSRQAGKDLDSEQTKETRKRELFIKSNDLLMAPWSFARFCKI